MINYNGRHSIVKDIIKRAMNKAQADIDEQLKELGEQVVDEYYEDFKRLKSKTKWAYQNTYNFLENSFYLSHHQNISNNGFRHYRYIRLHFSPEKMKNTYHDYYGNIFHKEQVFYQNFHKGYHGRKVFRGVRKNDGYWLMGEKGLIPKTQLDKYWNDLRKTSNFNKMFDDKLEEAAKEIGEELDKEYQQRLFNSKKIGGRR